MSKPLDHPGKSKGAEALRAWLSNLPGFRHRLDQLVVSSTQFSLGFINDEPEDPQQHDWNYLLMCASLFSSGELEEYQEISLRIAQLCLTSHLSSQPQRDAASLILNRLNNSVALQLAKKRGLIKDEVFERMPLQIAFDHCRRSLETTITLSDGVRLHANRFQAAFWKAARGSRVLSVSAPTSAGKSFIVKRWIFEAMTAGDEFTAVYIVPTRALISEVSSDLSAECRTRAGDDINVITLPNQSGVAELGKKIMVFTQERYQLLMERFAPSLRIDLLIVDEAQQVDSGARGVLLRQVIDFSLYRHPDLQLIFCSALTDNPGALQPSLAAEGPPKTIRSEQITVNQNLFWVSQVPRKPRNWNVELVLDGTPKEFGVLELEASPTHETKKLSFIAHSMADSEDGNLIYVNSASDAEKVCSQLAQLEADSAQTGQLSANLSRELDDLAELITKSLHKKFCLAPLLKHRVAFHYGNIPQLIRTEVERLFDAGALRFLACTSTLLEGVNLSCRNIFIRGPKKGRGNPMSLGDFWNLAGRSGRWGREFEGNIFCIDPHRLDQWPEGPPARRSRYRLTPASETISSRVDRLIDYIDAEGSISLDKSEEDVKYLSSYLFSLYLEDPNLRDSPVLEGLKLRQRRRVLSLLSEKALKIDLPVALVQKNPGISPFGIRRLLDYLISYNEDPHRLLPSPIESQDAVDNLALVFHRIQANLGEVFGKPKRVKQCAIVVVQWMRGMPLPSIIDSRLRSERRRRREAVASKLQSLIRNTLQDIDTVARFLAPKYLACYLDTLAIAWEGSEKAQLLEELPDFAYLLELGVSQTTQVSLLELGLSRSTAVALSEFIIEEALTPDACKKWLKSLDLDHIDLPAIMKREILGITSA